MVKCWLTSRFETQFCTSLIAEIKSTKHRVRRWKAAGILPHVGDEVYTWPHRVLQNDLWASESPLTPFRCVFSLSSRWQPLIPSSSLPSFHLDHHKQTHTYYSRKTPPPELQHTLPHSQIEDIAMMDTKARGWKLRPDVTSNQGLITTQYISLDECVCVCVCGYIIIPCRDDTLRAMSSHTY